MADEEEDNQVYLVVVNHEEQYSIWPKHREVPAGWSSVGPEGSRSTCLEYIGKVWTDMRPLSLRKRMEEWAKNPPPPQPEPEIDDVPPLVDRLSQGSHRVQFSSRPERTRESLKRAIDRGYVHILFPDTRGGTELGVRLDPAASDCTQGNFDAGTGEIVLIGNLVLDDVPVQCKAHLQLATLEGTGGLSRLS